MDGKEVTPGKPVRRFEHRLVDFDTVATAPDQWGIVILAQPPATGMLELLERNGWRVQFPMIILVEGHQRTALYVRSERTLVSVPGLRLRTAGP